MIDISPEVFMVSCLIVSLLICWTLAAISVVVLISRNKYKKAYEKFRLSPTEAELELATSKQLVKELCKRDVTFLLLLPQKMKDDQGYHIDMKMANCDAIFAMEVLKATYNMMQQYDTGK